MRKEKPTFHGIFRDATAERLSGHMIDDSGLTIVQGINMMPLLPLGLCPNVPSPCGHCWYCKQREVRP
jgi:hypothetical protein